MRIYQRIGLMVGYVLGAISQKCKELYLKDCKSLHTKPRLTVKCCMCRLLVEDEAALNDKHIT